MTPMASRCGRCACSQVYVDHPPAQYNPCLTLGSTNSSKCRMCEQACMRMMQVALCMGSLLGV